MARLRCAIYTRKSSEEGLEQGFNSLHAQREACEAYVLSQAGEGWTALSTLYEDGGFSGGNMERPGLKALMADIRQGLVDIVVVYKVDRLTRSLADFAKIVELFDQQQVSFVSVTQAFNTTTSMGRLTLNVLLSFAQFEREVTGERIRDKIAASKAKGMWMGGQAPLGYSGRDNRLHVNEAEAETVRDIFQRYLRLPSVEALRLELDREGIRSRKAVAGQAPKGFAFSRGALHYLLSNPIYRGFVRHKGKLHPAPHTPIIDQGLWDEVQTKLKSTNASQPKTAKITAGLLFRDRVFDDQGRPMKLSFTSRQGRHYRYYVSPSEPGQPRASLERISVGELDRFVISRVKERLNPDWSPSDDADARAAAAIERIQLGAEEVRIRLLPGPIALDAQLGGNAGSSELAFSVRLKHGHSKAIIDQAGRAAPAKQIDRTLVRAVVLAREWARQLEAGEVGSVKELARRYGLCEHYTARLIPLAYLAPDLIEVIMEGRQPAAMTLAGMSAQPLPNRWAVQQRAVAGLRA